MVMRKTQLFRLFALSPSLELVVADIKGGNAKAALERVNQIKATRSADCSTDIAGVDYCRALCFLNGAGNLFEARQAILEELRHTPHNSGARLLLYDLNQTLRPFLLPNDEVQAQEDPLFYSLCDSLLDYTMLTWPRLLQLYKGVMDLYSAHPHIVPGHILECGTAGGGSAVLMAVALAHAEDRYEKRTGQAIVTKKKVFALDTYEGMPAPTAEDAITLTQGDGDVQRVSAVATAWSTGTCAASTDHVQKLARAFGVEDRIVTVKGLFQDTLPPLLSSDSSFAEGIALAHIDADWYESVKFVLDTVWTHVETARPDGGPPVVVQVDDYHYWTGCKQAVDEVFAKKKRRGSEEGVAPALTVNRIDTNAVYFLI